MNYVEVIIPVKVDFIPTYKSGKPLEIGRRLYVNFAGQTLLGVVSKTVDNPPQDIKIKEVGYIPADLPLITENELHFWKVVSDYYLCPIGIIYKAAYPETKSDAEMARHKDAADCDSVQQFTKIPLTAEQERAYSEVLNTNGNTLLYGPCFVGKSRVALAWAQKNLQKGKTTLFLASTKEQAKTLAKKFTPFLGDNLLSYTTDAQAQKRTIAEKLRSGERAYVVVGTYSALFLPYRNLGGVVVTQENDTAYRITVPRINVRDASLFLAQIHGCRALLLASTPSLETLYNVTAGKYAKVELTQGSELTEEPNIEIVDTNKEKRMGGMLERVSRRLIARISQSLNTKKQVLILRNYYSDIEPQVDNVIRTQFPDARIEVLKNDAPAKDQNKIKKAFEAGEIDILIGTFVLSQYASHEPVGLVGCISTDSLFSKDDFRADELAINKLLGITDLCKRHDYTANVIFQTNMEDNQLLQNIGSKNRILELLFDQRVKFNYPPYSRVVDILVQDGNAARAEKLIKILHDALGISLEGRTHRITIPYEKEDGTRQFKVFLRRDVPLTMSKTILKDTITSFEKKYSYFGHILIGVDA